MQDTIGIDISKATLDIHRQSNGRHARFGNDRTGLTALRRWIGKAPVRVVCEAIGRDHRDMGATLDAAGHAQVKVSPGRARRFAQAAGYGARTDRVEAAMLARMGMALDLDATPVRSESMHEIKELHVARLGLIKDRTACRNCLQAARNKVVLAQLRARPSLRDPAVHSRHRPRRRDRDDRRDAGTRRIGQQGGSQPRGPCVDHPRVGNMEGSVTDRRRTARIASGALHASSGHDPPQHRTRPGLPDALRCRKTRESRDHRRHAQAPASRQRADPR